MRTHLHTLAVAAALLASAGAAGAQECAAGSARTGTLGIGMLHCVGGSCAMGVAEGAGRAHRFSTEPRVWHLDPRGPAAVALREGDAITAVDGALITTREGGRKLANLAPRRAVTLRVRRARTEMEVRLVPVAGCDPQLVVSRSPARPPLPGRLDAVTARGPAEPPVSFGVEVQCGECGWRREGARWRWYTTEPVRVAAVDPGAPAARAGIRPGDVLLAVDGRSLAAAEAGRALGALRPGQPVRLSILRGDETLEVVAAPEAGPPERRPAPPPSRDDNDSAANDLFEAGA